MVAYESYDQSLKLSTETSINKSNPTTLTDLEDLQSLHQTTVSTGVVAMFCPEYCPMSPVVYGVIQATSAIVLPLSINMQ